MFQIFSTPRDAAEAVATDLAAKINSTAAADRHLTLALSGGNTPGLLFSVLAEKYSLSINWNFVDIFWVDERCVPPDHPESNYGMTREKLLAHISIPETNIHRIKGEADSPREAAASYSGEIMKYTRSVRGIPGFDIIILGMGEDGHTASIFPGRLDLFVTNLFCETSVHPVSGQNRITLTGKVINNAGKIIFLVTGNVKAQMIREIFMQGPEFLNLPAAHIIPSHGEVKWYIDTEAGHKL